MMLKLLIVISFVTFSLGQVAATSCYELQQSQLNALNERMNQMIETISSLLPKSLKKLKPSVTPIPVVTDDYIPSASGHENSYYNSAAAYTTLPPIPPYHMPQVMYVPPSYASLPTPIAAPPSRHPNPVATPLCHYSQAEARPQQEYPLTTMAPFIPQPLGFNYQYDQSTQYINPIPIPQAIPPPFLPAPYVPIQSSHPLKSSPPYSFQLPLPAPTYPNIPAYPSGIPLFSVPVPIPPATYIQAYPQLPELPHK